MLCNLLSISSRSPKKLLKVSLKLMWIIWTDKWWLSNIICIKLHGWINLKLKTRVLNLRNNVKIELNLKVKEVCRDYSPNFLWKKWQCTKFLFSFIRGTFSLWSTRYGEYGKIVNGWIHWTIFAEIPLKLSRDFFYYYQLTLLRWIFQESF